MKVQHIKDKFSKWVQHLLRDKVKEEIHKMQVENHEMKNQVLRHRTFVAMYLNRIESGVTIDDLTNYANALYKEKVKR